MMYTCQYFQLNAPELRVPGYEDDEIKGDNPANIDLYKLDPSYPEVPIDEAIWKLVFSYELGSFYTVNESVPGIDGAIIKSWYAKFGPNGNNSLVIKPFLTGEGEFAIASNFVDFSEGPNGTSINTDAIENESVTATVHAELPEYSKIEIHPRSSSGAIGITMVTTNVVFDHFFIYYRNDTPSESQITILGNTITVNKGYSCSALAVYRVENHTSTSWWRPILENRIPEWEWPIIVSNMFNDFVNEGYGEIYQYIDTKLISNAKPETIKQAISSIDKRIEKLTDIKSIMSSIIKKDVK